MYLICRNILRGNYNRNTILALIDWIIDWDSYYLYNAFNIIIEFFPSEIKQYFIDRIEPFFEEMKNLKGVDQLIFGLSSVYSEQSIDFKGTGSSLINDRILLRFLEMLEVEFIDLIIDIPYEMVLEIATSKSDEECIIDYNYCLQHPEKLRPIYDKSTIKIVEKDLIKLETFLERLSYKPYI